MYPKMLIMRNSRNGGIWQAYRVENLQEEEILTRNARGNGFLVESEEENYTEETSPGWRETPEWQSCLKKEEIHA